MFDFASKLFIINSMLAIVIISLGILSRLLVHTPNFTPVLSMAFLGGMYLRGRQAILVPLALMVISDLIIGSYPLMLLTWGSMALIGVLGLCLKQRKSFAAVLGGSILSALIFFVVTNFGAWLTLYPHTLNGLQQCYILAIPFFRSTLASTVAYSLVFYAAYEWLLKRSQGSSMARFV